MPRQLSLALAALLLCLNHPAEARGKGGGHHSSGHSSHDSHTSSSSVNLHPTIRSHRDGERDTTATGNQAGPLPAGNGPASAQEEAKAKAQAEAKMAMRDAQQADDARRREQAAEHARMADEARQRKVTEERAQAQENARQTRLAEAAMREAQCQIKGVMTDAEIATCRRVWASNAR